MLSAYEFWSMASKILVELSLDMDVDGRCLQPHSEGLVCQDYEELTGLKLGTTQLQYPSKFGRGLLFTCKGGLHKLTLK